MTTKKRKSNLALIAGVIMSLTPAILFAEVIEAPVSPQILLPPPKLKKVEAPEKKTYQIGEAITYQISVELPTSAKTIRMNSPELDLENLTLEGVKQEAEGEQEQVLSFQFKGIKPGEAKINRFTLRWTYGEGLTTNELSIPARQFTIVVSHLAWIKYGVPIMALLLAGGIAFTLIGFIQAKKKKKTSVPVITLEDQTMGKLQTTFNRWANEKAHKIFLSEMGHIFQEYLSQKLDWNPTKADYNELQKTTEGKWGRREGQELVQLLKSLEFQRFSGSEPNQQELNKIYESIYSLVRQKKGI